jgi:hypothetical protein
MKPARRREVVDQVTATWQVSIRRACSVLRAERSSYHYKGKRRPQAVLMKRIKEIAETRVRYGYRRIYVLLRREGAGPVGFHPRPRCGARLLPTGKADGQCLHRVVQRKVPN